MANHIINKTYNDVLRKLEPTDPGHADTFNPLFNQLLNNEAYLKNEIESVKSGDLSMPSLPTEDKTIGGSITEITQKQENMESQLVESTGYGVITGLEVTVVHDMTVKVSAGVVHMENGVRVVSSGNSALVIDTADLTYARKDIVYVKLDGAIGYTSGIPSEILVAPTVPVNAFLLAEIYIASNTTTITNENITDKRKFKNTLDDLKKEVESQKADIEKKMDKIIPDDTLPKKYTFGISNGLLYYKEVL